MRSSVPLSYDEIISVGIFSSRNNCNKPALKMSGKFLMCSFRKPVKTNDIKVDSSTKSKHFFLFWVNVFTGNWSGALESVKGMFGAFGEMVINILKNR